MRTRNIFFAVTCVTLATGLNNACSKQGFKTSKHQDLTQSSELPPIVAAGLEDEFAAANSARQINAFQDVQFKFKIPGATAGATITAAGLPTWLTIDNASGELRGVPLSAQNSSVTLNVNGQELPPYTINVIVDPVKQYQWHLKNTGQAAFAGSTGKAGEDIHLEGTIRDRILGKNIKVAISDTGLVENHRGLKPNILVNGGRNYLNNFAQTQSWSGDATPNQAVADNAHGTGVAGLIGERGWQGIGGRGVAPLAKLAGFLFIQAQEQLVTAGLITAAFYDQYQGDFDVFNYSWGDIQCGLWEYEQALRDRWKLTAQTARTGKGAVLVKAAGNEFVGALSDCYNNQAATAFYLGNSNFSEDTSSPYLITVAALSAEGVSSSYSSPGANVWVTAPGGEYGWKTSPNNQPIQLEPAIVTTDFTGSGKGLKSFSADRNDFNSGVAPNTAFEHTATFNGTSSAAPIVTGAVALILSANPALSWRDVKHILAVTADKVDPTAAASPHPQAASNLTGHTYEQGWITNAGGMNFHNWYGFGRINVDAAVNMAKTYVSQLGTFKETNTGAIWKYDSGNLANLAVPPGVATGVSRTLTVSENYKVEAIEIRLSAIQCIGALGVELTSPSGTKSIVMNINSMILDSEILSHIFVSNAFYNENSAGTWTLKLIGGRANCTTQWRNWQLNVLGH